MAEATPALVCTFPKQRMRRIGATVSWFLLKIELSHSREMDLTPEYNDNLCKHRKVLFKKKKNSNDDGTVYTRLKGNVVNGQQTKGASLSRSNVVPKYR